MEFHGLTLDTFQEDAIRAIGTRRSVVVAAPTGCGKTIIAEAALEQALESGRRAFYTGPIKALSNQKYRDFCDRWGPDKVGIVTGDVSINPTAQIVIMTTEIFRNALFDGAGGNLDGVDWVVFDEVHYLGDADRGTVWEESIIFAPEHIRFVCLSATVPNAEDFTDWLEFVRKAPVDYILEPERPVPLKPYVWIGGAPFSSPKLKGLQRQVQKFKRSRFDKDKDARSAVQWLKERRRLPALFFCFNRRECERKAGLLAGIGFTTSEEEDRLRTSFDTVAADHGLDVESGSVSQMRDLVSRGVAFHHAGLLPALKDIVERLFGDGGIQCLVATETFALGVNMPAASVLFDGFKKYNGSTVDYLLVREYTQMAGRAGRRGMDSEGTIVGLLEPRDYDNRAIRKLLTGPIEALRSRFDLSYASLCNLVDRVGGRIGETLEKSFAVHAGGAPERRRRRIKKLRSTLEERIDMLQSRGYLEGTVCTDWGRVMGRLNGFEVLGCEWLRAGVFDDINDEEIAVLAMAAVFESRRNDWYRKPDWDDLEEHLGGAFELCESWRAEEIDRGLDPLKELDFAFTKPVQHWFRGGAFADFSEVTDAGEGDIVRNVLLCCQFLRQLMHAAPDPVLAARLRAVRGRLFRDEMDAESQLRRVAGVPEPAGEGGPL